VRFRLLGDAASNTNSTGAPTAAGAAVALNRIVTNGSVNRGNSPTGEQGRLMTHLAMLDEFLKEHRE
jgi:hypothetical protein